MKLERDIASDIWGLRGIIQLLLNFIKLYNSDPIALNEFVEHAVVCSQINNLNAPVRPFQILFHYLKSVCGYSSSKFKSLAVFKIIE